MNCSLYLVVNCGAPGLPSSGTTGGLMRNYISTEYNATAIYSCESTGYELNGENERECLANGQWSGEPPECQCKIISYLLCITSF